MFRHALPAYDSLPMKILLVEDDRKVARFVTRALAEEGYVVDACASGAEGITRATSGVYDAVVLDWMLPDVDGLSVCREVRAKQVRTPILMLTARGELQEKVLGLNAGADDYLVKPFEIDELLARVRALLRRTTGYDRLRCGPIELDREQRRALVDGAPVELTSREYALLLHLLSHVNKVSTRAELLAHVWETHFDPGSNLVDVHISRLREKLGSCASMIETVRGLGYRVRESGSP